ncbi:hypothetical protein [Roseisolibacter sp. H3M3-2]|uniref:hypothetical protein n=1 Tax=Roseisolibacter sp. H3M3-2 TaxID=3031323 RepID=UPI0023DB8EB5|nr:hypothetical protein [Roseisolibacter sp. H3M3-2]MDF1505396.1 hypothetical protein [Roseisolibacter sp. H3M3-2]
MARPTLAIAAAVAPTPAVVQARVVAGDRILSESALVLRTPSGISTVSLPVDTRVVPDGQQRFVVELLGARTAAGCTLRIAAFTQPVTIDNR